MSFDVCSEKCLQCSRHSPNHVWCDPSLASERSFPAASLTFSKTYSKHQQSLDDSYLTVRCPSSLFCTGIKEISKLMFLLLTNVPFTSSSLSYVWTLVFFSAPMVARQLQINWHNCSCFGIYLKPEDHRYCDHYILSICPNIQANSSFPKS